MRWLGCRSIQDTTEDSSRAEGKGVVEVEIVEFEVKVENGFGREKGCDPVTFKLNLHLLLVDISTFVPGSICMFEHSV